MTTLFVVVPLALLVSTLAVFAFVWSVKHGQLDDLSTPALRMLEEETKSKATPQFESKLQSESKLRAEEVRKSDDSRKANLH